ncbi:hypothetical protein ACLOAV_010699 [Pseudogymnoascus australis]
MIGEEKTDGPAFQAVNCYSSKNLVEWSFEASLLTRTEEDGDLGPNRIIERPKVIKNDKTGKYVMWMHVDSPDYKDARVGVATADSVCGKYEYRESFRPFDYQSRDIGLFKDGDGSAYLLTEDRDYGTRIIKLTDDYLNVEKVTFGWQYFAESPALVKVQDTYFIFGSHLTGWNANDNIYSYAKSLEGPWSEWTEFAPVGSKTHASQVNYVLPLGSDKALYMGDRWVENNLAASTYIWLPLKFDGTSVKLDWYESWTVDMEAGNWYSVDAKMHEGEAAALSNNSVVVGCNLCSGSKAAGYIGGEDNGTVTFNVDVTSNERVTLTIKYWNNDYDSRFATFSVNGREKQTAAFLSTGHYYWGVGSSVIHVDLREGSNTIVVSGSDGWGPDVDALRVPDLKANPTIL